MKKNFLKILVGITFVSLCLVVYIVYPTFSNSASSIDLTGSNNLWKVSLNVHLKHDSELIICPRRDDFNIPSEINVNVIVNNNSIYNGKLKYISDSNKKFLGKYMTNLISDSYFKRDTNNVCIIIKYNGKSNSLTLN